MNWTVNRIAHLQASSLGMDEDGKKSLHRTVRNIVTKNVVESVADEADSRGTRLLNDEQAAAVLLLVPLSQMAVDVRGLREIAGFLTSIRLNEQDTQIGHAIAQIKEGKAVTLIHELRVRRQSGELKQRTSFAIEGEEPTGDVAEILAADELVNWKTLASFELDASEILRSFVS